MTRKDFDKVICSYFDLLIENKELEQSIGEDENIEAKDIAQLIISGIAKKTEESSNIWICIGSFKTSDSKDDILDRYYCFIDLETCKERLVSSLDYGEFCRNNSVILLDNYYEIYGVKAILKKGMKEPVIEERMEPILGVEGFNILRNNFLSDLSFYLINPDNNINVDDFCKHYNDVVNSYKKDGKLTLEINSFTRR